MSLRPCLGSQVPLSAGRAAERLSDSGSEGFAVWDSFGKRFGDFAEWLKEWLGKRWPTVISVLLSLVLICGFCWWWIGPVYDPNLMTVSNVAINGVKVSESLPDSVINRVFTLTCTIRSNGKKFLAVDSKGTTYTGFIRDEAVCKRAMEESRLDPVFTGAFTSFMRAGRNMQGVTSMCGVKINEAGDTADITVRIRAPRSSGRFELKLEVLSCDGMFKQANGDKAFKPGTIFWRKPVTVLAK